VLACSAFHSINSLVCSADESGSGSGQQRIRIIVLLDKLTSVLSVDQGSRQLGVQAGMSMAGLLAAANSARLSMPLLTLPDYVGLIVGGVLATAATGTGLGTTAGLVDIVVSLTWVNAKGEVRTSSRYSREGRALVGGAGLLGVITEVTLQLEPWTLMRVDTPAFRRPDWTLAEDIQNILKVGRW
jgi:FAD/FMN-containing dehydrogenase